MEVLNRVPGTSGSGHNQVGCRATIAPSFRETARSLAANAHRHSCTVPRTASTEQRRRSARMSLATLAEGVAADRVEPVLQTPFQGKEAVPVGFLVRIVDQVHVGKAWAAGAISSAQNRPSDRADGFMRNSG